MNCASLKTLNTPVSSLLSQPFISFELLFRLSIFAKTAGMFATYWHFKDALTYICELSKRGAP